ncbi:MAG: vWA domain-containing protein [Planctomycetaceae bacterium]
MSSSSDTSSAAPPEPDERLIRRSAEERARRREAVKDLTSQANTAMIAGDRQQEPIEPREVSLGPPRVTDPSLWQSFRGMFLIVPAWLVSLFVHLAIFLTLTVLMCSPPQPEWDYFLEAQPFQTDNLLVNEVEFIPPEMEALEQEQAAPAGETLEPSGDLSESVTMLNGSEVANLEEAVEASTVGDGALSSELGGRRRTKGMDQLGVEFFGVQSKGKKFIFIVDSSNSMRGSRFEAAKQELMLAIRRLSKEQSFLVMFFDQNTEIMRLAPKKEPERFPVPATEKNIAAVQRWVNEVGNELHTDPYEAMRIALDIAPDAIYLLSDGKLTDKGKTIDFLMTQNRLNDPLASSKKPKRFKAIVHTIAFYSREGEETLEFIAKNNGGTYRFVPRPTKKKKLP